MGNILIEEKGKSNLMKAFESYIDQNPEFEQVSRSVTLYEGKLFRTLSFKFRLSSLIFKVYLLRKQIDTAELLIHENNFLFYLKQISNRKYHNLLPFSKIINFTDKTTYQQIDKATDLRDKDINREYLAVARQ